MDSFAEVEGIERLVLSVREEDVSLFRALAEAWSASRGSRAPGVDVVAGGARRRDSVLRGLEALRGHAEWALVHDAARPLVTTEEVRSVIEAIRRHGAAAIGTPAQDSMKRVVEGTIVDEIARDEVWTVQTPQGARLEDLIAAYSKDPLIDWTDEASALRAMGMAVAVVEGSRENLKITRPGDEAMAERIIEGRRSRGRARG
jgi:2-C-methyl-D-erythritol 4-phosphate cytidylyltransferase